MKGKRPRYCTLFFSSRFSYSPPSGFLSFPFLLRGVALLIPSRHGIPPPLALPRLFFYYPLLPHSLHPLAIWSGLDWSGAGASPVWFSRPAASLTASIHRKVCGSRFRLPPSASPPAHPLLVYPPRVVVPSRRAAVLALTWPAIIASVLLCRRTTRATQPFWSTAPRKPGPPAREGSYTSKTGLPTILAAAGL
ncbi:hypothetical protein B0T24DRAFT_257712 [Lasiosphaeria ovina]|uniref:Uncharacterized protein n=1 Tax=Lasiosphaeria ovina TaxID=92902 RepID=A0AAE0N7V3_9PEZI|nr:hypothetical protein B0T24DRAFT_257712 [Lasiosphaeria ovina]